MTPFNRFPSVPELVATSLYSCANPFANSCARVKELEAHVSVKSAGVIAVSSSIQYIAIQSFQKAIRFVVP